MCSDTLHQGQQERVLWPRKNESIVDSCWMRGWSQPGQLEERVQWLQTSDVEVKVDAAVSVKQQIADDVGALDRLGVVDVVRKEIRVVVADEQCGILVGPEAVLLATAGMECSAACHWFAIFVEAAVVVLVQVDLVGDPRREM
jgi:hypothetical protein